MPVCNAEHHGYELLATIDGTDTKFSCNIAHGLYSWMGVASEGGFLGADIGSFFSSVVSGAAGAYIVTLTEDAGISTELTIRPGQDVRVSGDPGLSAAPSWVDWGSGAFVVQERGSLSLTNLALENDLSVLSGGSASLSGCVLETSFRLGAGRALDGHDVSLSLSSMAVPQNALSMVVSRLSGDSTRVQLSAITVPELPDAGELTGTITVSEDGNMMIEGSLVRYGSPVFDVESGECTVSEGGRCVGRPEGYGPNEYCAIAVVGGGGLLGECGVFDTIGDSVTLTGSGGWSRTGSDCPQGALLSSGDEVRFNSDGGNQGSVGTPGYPAGTDVNGCVAKGTCGLPNSRSGLGGGWRICFA